MEKSLAKSSQRSSVAPVHTINVVFPERTHSSHSATSGKGGDELVSTDRSRDRSSSKMNAVHPNAEISAVPDPVPNPLFQAPPSSRTEGHSTPPLAEHASTTVFAYSSTLVVSSSLLLSPSTTSVLSSTSSLSRFYPASISAERPLGTFNNVPSRQTTPHRLPAAAIALVTSGSVLFVVAILFLSRLCIRPRRRSHPTPSLPILQDAFLPRKTGDESPLFGGKERLSSQPDAVPWTWTQYQSDTPKPVPTARISKLGSTNQPPMRHSRLVDEPHNVHPTGGCTIQDTMAKLGTTNSTLDGVPKKSLSRLSSLSGLVYTASVYETTGPENIGIAVSSGQGDLEFSGPAAAREHRKRASARQSMRNFDKRRSTIDGSPEGLAYTMSPSISPSGDSRDETDGFPKQGRARVKAPYVAGSYLRGSAPKGPDRAVQGVNPFADPGNGEYALPPMPGSSTGKENNRKGGALVEPTIIPDAPVSPGFSLYPDDSLSVAEDRIWTAKGKIYDQDGNGVGDVEDSMTVTDERSSNPASPGVATGRSGMSKTRRQSQEVGKLRRTDDRPPRVPSPPVLPSLAQMAMAHTNVQEYGDYRSPTYSLYGLYS
ncbi:hypothetical protein F5148DRAFT_1282766 [Russula earlei]|uniref:Uncharacterized protein n=1 Tax=Russula earlei TaxID=71964 RepID=A0ACC0UDS3_9AGAM|nr:hypothetical protein F5148DRAFT_1282766 [Russula earlei]